MGREMRWRTPGILFYLIFVLSLIVSQAGEGFVRNLFSNFAQLDIYQIVVALIGIGVGLFTSDAVGFAFNTVVFFWWEILLGRFRSGEGGYSAERRKRAGYNLKDVIIERYKNALVKADADPLHQKFEGQWEKYSADVFLSYIWQYAPRYIDDWDTRRYNAFFTNLSTAVGILSGFFLSTIIILTWNMGWTLANYIIAIIAFSLITMLFWNANVARKEAWQMVDLWVAGIINPRLQMVINNMRSSISGY